MSERRIVVFDRSALLLLLGLIGNVCAQTSVIVGKVTEAGGKGVPDVPVRIVGISEQRTSSTGEFRIELPNAIRPGNQITLSVGRPGWIIKNPPYGQVNVPSDSGQVINVVLIPAPPKTSAAGTPDQAELTAPGPYAEKEKELLDDGAFYRWGSWDKDEPFSLKIHIHGKFRNSVFNSEQFLPALSEFTCIAPTCSREVQGDFMREANEIEWTAYIGLPKRPSAADVFTFSTGPRVWSVKFGDLVWKQYRGKDKNEYIWYGAQASLNLTLSDPDWVVLRSARLQRLVESNQYILEAVVENRSAIPIPLSYLHLNLTHPKSDGVSCEMADPQVTLTLAWERILSQRDESSEPTAWAQIGKSTLEVPNRARLNGHCSNFSFFAVVPVDVDVAPKALVRIDIKIVDLPSPARRTPPREGIFPPGLEEIERQYSGPLGLTGWRFMSVGVKGALPGEVVVERSGK